MASPPGASIADLTRRVAQLEADLTRARASPATPPCRRDTPPWLGAGLLVIAFWGLAAQSPAPVTSDLEQRVIALESRIRRGPGNATQIAAPFDVLGADGKAILRVSSERAPGASVSIWKRS